MIRLAGTASAQGGAVGLTVFVVSSRGTLRMNVGLGKCDLGVSFTVRG